MANEVKTIGVPFHGSDLILVDVEGEPYTPMKPIVEGMGLSWTGQNDRLNRDRERWGIRVIRIPSERGDQDTLCMPLRKLPGWLMTVQVSRLKPEIREKALAFQNECDDVLWNYWSKGRVLPSPSLPDRETIREEIRKVLAEPPSATFVPDFADGIRCLDGLAQWAAEAFGPDACLKIDRYLSDLHRVLETGRDRLKKLASAEGTLAEERRLARKWVGSGDHEYFSAEFRKSCQ